MNLCYIYNEDCECLQGIIYMCIYFLCMERHVVCISEAALTQRGIQCHVGHA